MIAIEDIFGTTSKIWVGPVYNTHNMIVSMLSFLNLIICTLLHQRIFLFLDNIHLHLRLKGIISVIISSDYINVVTITIYVYIYIASHTKKNIKPVWYTIVTMVDTDKV